MPSNVQFTPYFEFVCDKNTTIRYYVNNSDGSTTYPGKSNYKNVYHAVKGEQKFEDYSWQNGEYLIVEIPKGVKLLYAGYRISSYNCATVSDGFSCEDAFFNKLYAKALNTLTVTMRDNYMDCPDRERAQWIGDAAIESEMSYYALSPESALLFKKSILTLYGWQHEDGVFQTVAPDGVAAYELPQQNLAAIVAFGKYLLYTGDYSVFDEIYALTFDYLKVFKLENGLVSHRKGSWDWGDWGKNVDFAVLDNAWYYYALNTALQFAETAENSSDIAFCKTRIKSIEDNFDNAFWHENGYSSNNKFDDRANALAVLCGLAAPDKYDAVKTVLTTTFNSSPYMEKYVEEALCVMGRTDLALQRACNRYGEMVAYDCSTLWELWQRNKGTANHAWSGGTMVILGKYVSGIQPTAAGYDSYTITPDFSVFDKFSYKINPKSGKYVGISTKLSNDGRDVSVYSDLCGGTLVLRHDGTVLINGVEQVGDDGVFSIEIPVGTETTVQLRNPK